MDFNLFIAKAKEKLKAVEIYYTSNKSMSISLFENEVKKYNVSNLERISIRAIYKNKLSTISLENLDNINEDQIIDKLIENSKYINNTEKVFIYKKNEVINNSYENDLESFSYNDKLELLKNISKKTYAFSNLIRSVRTVYDENINTIRIINSYGLDKKISSSNVLIYNIAVASKKDESKDSYEILVKKNFKDLLDNNLELAARKAIKKLGSSSIKTESYKTVLSNEAFSSLLGGFLSIFSAEQVLKNMTLLSDKINEKIAIESLNLIDDPFIENDLNPILFDDEGVNTKKKYIIKDGILKSFFHNLKTSNHFKVKPTGNGFKPSFASSISTSHTNLYIKKGKNSLKSLLKEADNGIYINSLQGLHAGINTISGDFSLQSSGFTIKNGKLDLPVSLIVISGNIFDIFKNIKLLGKDLKFNTSRIATPSVYLGLMKISGV